MTMQPAHQMRIEPTDTWIRAYVGDVAVVDSRQAVLFYEPVFPIPAYAFPRADVLEGALQPSRLARPAPGFSGRKCPVPALYDVVVGDRVLEGAAWVRDNAAIDDRVVLTWEPGVFETTTQPMDAAGVPQRRR